MYIYIYHPITIESIKMIFSILPPIFSIPIRASPLLAAPEVIVLATSIEIIHTASLVHDAGAEKLLRCQAWLGNPRTRHGGL